MVTRRGSSKLLVLAACGFVVACGFPRPAGLGGDAGSAGDAGGGADGAPDARPPPNAVIHVSPSGDDGNDGMTLPVKTLKHAIGLASENTVITTIILASGTYSVAGGETFPYTVPPNVTIIGPAGGGAILDGDTNETGMTVDNSALQDLELQDFTVAITATGVAKVTNIHIRTSTTAIRAETTAALTINNLDVTGATSKCATGVEAVGSASLTITTFAARGLGGALNASDDTTSSVTGATITGDPSCMVPVFNVASNKTFEMANSLLDGGYTGVGVAPASSAGVPAQVALTDVTIRNMTSIALSVLGNNVMFRMTGGEVSLGPQGSQAIVVTTTNVSFTNVTIDQNAGLAIFSEESSLTMRGCTVVRNAAGVDVNAPTLADFGTSTSPGNNVFQNVAGTGAGLIFEGTDSGPVVVVQAVGNTWKPMDQGTDQNGQYLSRSLISGPVSTGDNYQIQGMMSKLQL